MTDINRLFTDFDRNIIGASLATGVLNPLFAAILMPASSLTAVLGSWYGKSFARSTT